MTPSRNATRTPSPVIVIPAHNEASVIGRCLSSVLAAAKPGEFQVVIVSNGSVDATADRAREVGRRLGHEIEVVEISTASKVAALRAADTFFEDAEAPPPARLYLDADVLLTTDAARRLVAAVLDGVPDAPRLAMARIDVETSASSWLVRRYYQAWLASGYIARQDAGSGVFAMNAAGVGRVAPWPDVLNDDGYVARRFSSEETVVVEASFRSFAARSTLALVRRRARIVNGNRQLDAVAPRPKPRERRPPRPHRQGRTPASSALVFVGVTAAARSLAAWRRATGDGGRWSTDATTRQGAAGAEHGRTPGARAALARLASPGTWAHALKLANFYAYAHVRQRRLITAGPGLRMSPSVSMRNGERITLGREVHIGERSCLWAGDSTGRITLGDNALLGPEVFITASNYGLRTGTPIMYQPKTETDVVIGADVWLGVRVTVLPGVTIGAGAVVGAGSVVTKSLPANCVAAGIPAKVVGWRPGATPEPGEPS